MRPSFLARAGSAALALSFPVSVLALGVRAAMSHAFLSFEYSRAGFPADRFGFTAEDRLTYGSYGVDYLMNDAGPRYLGGLRLPDGRPLFTEAEVSHMADVKSVLATGLDVGLWLGIGMIVVAVLLRRRPGAIASGLRGGVLLTGAGIFALGIGALTGWERFFSWVHSLFFESGTWTFYADDTLIRLYPEQFWMDSAALVGGTVLLGCIAGWILGGIVRRSAR